VLIDLKRDKLTHQDLGQMQMYFNYFDRYVKTEDELYLPSKEELKRQLEEAAGITGHCENPDQEGTDDVR